MEFLSECTKEDEIDDVKEPKKKIKIGVTISIVIAIFIVTFGILSLLGLLVVSNNVRKPIIYLYPEKEEEITVKLKYPEKLTCSYPKYTNGWNVLAKPDGTLEDLETGKKLYSLYWEGEGTTKTNIHEGFILEGKDVAKFLEEKLEILGLTEREAEEFIIYWLPKLESNKYNYIRFASLEEINEYMPLEFSKEPDTLIRVLMQYKGLNSPIKVEEQKLETPERKGFVAVEWGGTEIE